MPCVTHTEDSQHWNDSLTIDRAARLVRNVAIAGAASRNGYLYSEEALREAAPLYEDRPVFLDHAEHRHRPSDRSTRDLVGTVTSARYSEGRIRGDIRVLDTESGEMFLKLAEAETPGVGMSHVVLAERSPDGRTVDRISEVVSVDVVVNPATTRSFRESTAPAALAVHSPVSELSQTATESQLHPAHLQREVQRLQQLLAESERQREVELLLTESGLPAEVVTECFRQQLLRAADEPARRALLRDRQQLLMRSPAASRLPLSESRAGICAVPPADELFVSVIRHRS